LLLVLSYDILIHGYEANTHIINLNIKGANENDLSLYQLVMEVNNQ